MKVGKKNLANITVLNSLVFQNNDKNSEIKYRKYIITAGPGSDLVNSYFNLITQCFSSIQIITVYST